MCKDFKETNSCKFGSNCPNLHREKNKYFDHNLDLNYITPRLIAMAYPTTARQQEFIKGQDAAKVAKFLKANHGENYLVVNLN